MNKLYIIAGPNGAGKTTLSYTVLPEIFDCFEFVNADEIAKGISPLSPEKAGIRSGRLMLQRIKELIFLNESFAIETTLSTKSYKQLVENAKSKSYEVILLFLTLDSAELAIQRVRSRVKEGGHNIAKNVIVRRYRNGLQNLFNIYIPIVSKWIIVNNSSEKFEFIAKGTTNSVIIKNKIRWVELNKEFNENY